MQDLITGQRCISDAELQMGLGTVLSVEQRQLTVLYLATGETRTYAKQSAPLTRITFNVGDNICNNDNLEITITSIENNQGLLTYTGFDKNKISHCFEESALNNFLQLNRPTERLFNGQIDKESWFELRYLTLLQKNRLAKSDLYGLTGCRTSLITHQLYIAHELANRFAPRALLADEVGLGKTIEAGLVLHYQLLTERAKRILIIVPETLLHQWLVEMLRRFNLHFKIFDAQRCDDLFASQSYENIFYAEQLVLCSIDFLAANVNVFEQCALADWDLMVVDEAHHLQWNQQSPSIKYMMIEQLSKSTKGILLLTATPEQLGKQSHFARLRLLDSQRFSNYQQFIKEEENYQPYADVVNHLLTDSVLSQSDILLLKTTLTEGDNAVLLEKLISQQTTNEEDALARTQLVEHLLDRHGTGRALFRNTRHAVKGFPERVVHHYPLKNPLQYQLLAKQKANQEINKSFTPEVYFNDENWLQIDPRVQWLQQHCQQLFPKKVLVICAKANTAIALTQYIKQKTGLHASVFHQGLSIIERDKVAAFFADKETGSQILICSEIGSEGRNFQFSHHLVLFDLPSNPDLLEQRIGRLDRIGQTETINIHVPYLEKSSQEILFKWYHHALDAFEHTCPVGNTVFKQEEKSLFKLLEKVQNQQPYQEELTPLITQSKKHYLALSETLQQGRDRLLEYNSSRPMVAEQLKKRAEKEDESNQLMAYMEQVYDCFGIDNQLHSDSCFIISPTEHMINQFPGLPDDGMTITYNRETALNFEDAHYISWEHPLTNTAFDLILTNENGNTAFTAIVQPRIKAGTLLIECLFSLESAPIEALQTNRYSPPTMVRIVCDEQGNNYQTKLSHTLINQTHKAVEQGIANKIVKAKKQNLKTMIAHCKKEAKIQAEQINKQAQDNANLTLNTEINRLIALAKVNPNIRQAEINHFKQQRKLLSQAIGNANLRLDAIRIIVAT